MSNILGFMVLGVWNENFLFSLFMLSSIIRLMFTVWWRRWCVYKI